MLVSELVPARHGEFEVELDGHRLFSRLESGRFPDYSQLKPKLERRLGPPPHWR